MGRITGILGTLLLCVASLAGTAAADPPYDIDHIGLYLEPDATVCGAPIAAQQVVTLHVLAVLPNIGDEGLVAAEFRIVGLPEIGGGGIYSANWNSDLVLGDLPTGLAIAFPEPLYGAVIELGTISFAAGNDDWLGDNAELFTDVAIGSGRLVVVNDSYEEISVAGSYFTFNCTIPELCECGRFSSPDCFVTPLAIDFGFVPVGEYSDRGFTITNEGEGIIEGVVTVANANFSIPEGGGIYTIASGQTHGVTVRYQPQGQGDHLAYVNTGAEYCGDVLCSGTSSEPIPICDVQPALLEFGEAEVGEIRYRSFVVSNIGEGILHGDIRADCEHFTIASGGGAFALGAGQAWPVSVRFRPLIAGEHECLITTGMDNDCPDVPCHGTALPGDPLCQVVPDELDFGDVQAGETATAGFTITNAGTGILMGTVSPVDAPFAVYAGEGAFALLPDESLTVSVRFDPTACGGFTDAVDLGSGLCDNVPLFGRGMPEGGATDHIGVYADAAGETCNADLTVGEQTTLHLLGVVECFADAGILGAEFRLDNLPDGPGGTVEFEWFADTVTGDPATGVILGWDAAQTGNIVEFGTLTLAPQQAGWVGDDHVITVASTLPGGELLIRDQAGNPWVVNGDRITLNCVQGLCDCIDFATPYCFLDPVEIDFGEVPLGVAVTRDFIVANAGYGILAGNLSVSGYGYSLLSGGGPFALLHGDTLRGTLRFRAEDCGGNYGGTILTDLDECPGIPCHATVPTPPAPRWQPIIGVFEDEDATTCDGPILLYMNKTIYVYAILPPEIPAITAAEFRIQNLPETGPGGIVSAAWNTPLVIGEPGWGIALAFSPALAGPIAFLGSISLFMLQEDWIGDDYELWVTPSNDSDKLVVVDHCFEEIDARGYIYTFNCSNECYCDWSMPVALSRFEMEDLGGASRVEWESRESGAAEFRLDARLGDESWQVEHSQSAPGLYLAEDDSPALMEGGEVTYSLFGRTEGEEWSLLREEALAVAPARIATLLLAPHPNPFNPAVSIPFSLASGGRVRVAIYNVAGRRVATLADGAFPRGRHSLQWLGRDDAQHPLPSGVYFARMEAAGYGANRKLILLR